jgi:hypothetical protein
LGPESAAPTAEQSSAIQGGTTDSTDTFSVGIIQTEDIQNDMVAYCTGVALGPNLVATARHCVAQLSSTTIDCATSTFGSLYPASDLYLTTGTTINPHTLSLYNNSVSSIIVPSGSGQDTVCGHDIALLILAEPLQPAPSQYVVPTINPPMTSSQYEPTVTAIGYGVVTPVDGSASTAGTRRIKQNVALECIPNDPNPSESGLDCFAASPMQAPMFLTAAEFMSGDSTCEGDSGSGAFEQSNFDAGKAVAFGVLSRGGTSTDGTTCIQPIYSRFDAWGSMLVSATTQAASLGGYAVPAWAKDFDAGSGPSSTSGSDAGGASASSSGTSQGGSGASSGASPTSGTGGDGTPCQYGSMCASGSCVATGGAEGVCASACDEGGSCGSAFTCQGGYCISLGSTATAASASTQGSAGCSVGAAPSPVPATPGLLFGIGLAVLTVPRSRRRHAPERPGRLSAS